LFVKDPQGNIVGRFDRPFGIPESELCLKQVDENKIKYKIKDKCIENHRLHARRQANGVCRTKEAKMQGLWWA
jgi:hypothetical protein